MPVKKLGIVTGLGPETSARFYLDIVKHFRNNEPAYPPILMRNAAISFSQEAEGITGSGNLKIREEITSALIDLKSASCELVCIPCNTVHIWLDHFRGSIPGIRILSIVDAVAANVVARNLRHLLILGSSLTVAERLYQSALEKKGIRTSTPRQADQTAVDNAILSINQGCLLDSDRGELMAIMKAYWDGQDAPDAILFACTDLFQLIKQEDCEMTILDSNKLLVDAVCAAMTTG